MLPASSVRSAGLVIVVALICTGLRLLEWPVWKEAAAWIDAKPILPTADAYAWVGGAEGTGRLAGWPMSLLIAAIVNMTGAAPEWVAFWLPVVLGPLPGVLIALICIRLGYASGGLAAGALAGGGLGYLARTRLGYADTDLFALTLAVALAWTWGAAMRTHVGGAGLPRDVRRFALYLAGTLTVLSAYMLLYPSGYPIATAIIASGACYAAATRSRADGGLLPAALGAVILTAHFGWTGLAAGLGFCLWLARSSVWPRLTVGAGALVVAGAAAVLVDADLFSQHIRRVTAYLGLVADPAASGWRLPSVGDSIRETGSAGPAGFAMRAGSHWILLLGGVIGYGLAVFRWPWLATFLPLLVLGLCSWFLGPRFAMYAGPVIGLGIGLGLAIVCELIAIARVPHLVLQLVMGAVIVSLLAWRALEPQPAPALAPGHAKALHALRNVSSDRGRVWAWWDRGYPAQYFSALPTFSDGGNTSRARIFALGQVFGATSPRAARQLMKSAAVVRSDRTGADWRTAAYGAGLLEALEGMDAARAQDKLERLAGQARTWPDGLPDEFLVVDWTTLRQAQWISHFSRWTLAGGESGHGWIESLRPPVRLDKDRGVLNTPEGPVPLLSLDILDKHTHYRNRWPRDNGVHAVINNASGEGVLMDSSLYRMMAVQMLIAEPGQFDADFELVSDQFPAARVYRAR